MRTYIYNILDHTRGVVNEVEGGGISARACAWDAHQKKISVGGLSIVVVSS